MAFQPYLIIFINCLIALLAIAFYTLLERKILGAVQLRKGPNKVSVIGLAQPIIDAIKLIAKEPLAPISRNLPAFFLAPVLTLTLILILWAIYPYPTPSRFFNLGILLFLCISSLNVYTTLAAGWASNSKYALLGAVRGVAQTISYEVGIALILLTTLSRLQTFDLNLITNSTTIPTIIIIYPTFFIWFITCLAETNRTPFDLLEGESELVSGFNIEYRGGGFALLFIAEYIRIIFLSIVSSIIFLSFNTLPTISILLIPIIISTLSILFIWARGFLPRLRYDQLITLMWKSILPLSIAILIATLSVLLNI